MYNPLYPFISQRIGKAIKHARDRRVIMVSGRSSTGTTCKSSFKKTMIVDAGETEVYEMKVVNALCSNRDHVNLFMDNVLETLNSYPTLIVSDTATVPHIIETPQNEAVENYSIPFQTVNDNCYTNVQLKR